MDDIIVIDDLTYQYYNQYLVFEHLSLTLKRGSYTSIIGANGSGKTTLVNLLLGLLKSDNKIMIDHLLLCPNNIKTIRNKMTVVFEHPVESFIGQTVLEEITLKLKKQNKSELEIKEKISEISQFLGSEKLLGKNVHSLSMGEQQLISFVSAVAISPDILILDEAFTMIDKIRKKKIFEYLKKINGQNHITILNITHDLDDSLYGDDILLLHDGNVKLHGTKEEVLKQEAILKKAGLKLPFLADLSIRLMYYGILDHMILDIDEMVNTIWK